MTSTVLFSFLSRADAFSPEQWGDYWRKVHAVRFLHPDEAGDEEVLAKLLQYDQIHRLAAGPSSRDVLPYRPPLDARGRLFDTIEGHVQPYDRPAWDGVAYLRFASPDDLQAVLGTERVRRKIVPEDRAMFRDLAPLLAQPHEILPGDAGHGIVLVKTHVRRPGLDRAAFQRRWLDELGPFVASRPRTRTLVRRYVQLHSIGPVEPGEPFFHPATAGIDGVTLMSFAGPRDVEAFLLSEDHAAIVAAERELSLADAGEFWTGVDFAVVDRSDK